MAARHLVVVPHTHWDREWYETHEQFRLRLVRLVDRLLEVLEGDPGFRHFTLDGQSIVLDDYLEVRPSRRERAEKLIRDGRLLVGPWYVLPDEWLVSGEALIRNLRVGLARAEAYGRAMRIGYAPDLFGHVGQLPQIFAGFGFEAAVVWRGVGADVGETVFDWEAPDGSRLPTVYLRHGYGNAVHLPLEPEALRRRLERDVALLAPFSRIPTFLLMNGSDHVEPQPGLPAALEAAVAGMPETTFEIGTLGSFLERALREAPADRALHRGELRSGLRAPLLPGCASSRMGQKRADFANDVLLTAYLEPLAAWLGVLGGDPGLDVLAHAWRVALQSHPHDSICGCSIDAVHEEIGVRIARVAQIARGHLDAVGGALAERLRPAAEGCAGAATTGSGAARAERGGTAAPAGEPAGEPVLVWNPHGPGPTGVDAELELDLPLRGGRPAPFHLVDAAGRRVPAAADVVDPGATLGDFELAPSGAAHLVEGIPPDFAGARLRDLRWRRVGPGRLEVDLRLAATPGELDAEAARRALLERLAAGDLERVRVRAARVPRVRLRFADALPGHGVRAYRVARGGAGGAEEVRAARRPDGSAVLESATLRVEVAADGRVSFEHAPTGLRCEDALRIASEGDRGDEYNFDPVPGDAPVERPERVRLSWGGGASEAWVRVAARYRVPAALAAGRAARSARRVALPVATTLRLLRGLDRLEIELEVDNTACDHRLRLLAAAPFAARRFVVESAFELPERPIAPGPDAFGPGRPAERPVGAGPMRRLASVDDGRHALTASSRGGGEVEALSGPGGRTELALTLLRAVGWLSRGDLALRPGDAGPPLATPGAQVPGRHRLAFALHLHAASAPGVLADALRHAVPALALPGRAAREGPLAPDARLVALDDPDVLITAIEPRDHGGVRVRLLNAAAEARSVRLRLARGLRCEGVVDLADRPDPRTPLCEEAGALRLALRGWQLATLRLAAGAA